MQPFFIINVMRLEIGARLCISRSIDKVMGYINEKKKKLKNKNQLPLNAVFVDF